MQNSQLRKRDKINKHKKNPKLNKQENQQKIKIIIKKTTPQKTHNQEIHILEAEHFHNCYPEETILKNLSNIPIQFHVLTRATSGVCTSAWSLRVIPCKETIRQHNSLLNIYILLETSQSVIQLEGRGQDKSMNQLLIYFRLIMKRVIHHEITQKREQESRKRSGLLPLKSKQEQASGQKCCSLPPMYRSPPLEGVSQNTWGLTVKLVMAT